MTPSLLPIKSILTNSMLNSRAWQEFAEHLVERYRLHICHIFLVNKKTRGVRFHVSAGQPIPSELAIAYLEQHMDEDPVLNHLMTSEQSRFVAVNMLPNAHEFNSGENYEKWVKPQGLVDAAMASFMSDDNWVGCVIANRHASQGLFSQQDIDELNDLYSALVDAGHIAFYDQKESSDARRLKAVVDTFRIPVAVLTEKGVVCAMNHEMNALVESIPDVAIENGCISLLDKQREKLLYMALFMNAKKIEGYNLDIDESEMIQLSDTVHLGFQPLLSTHLDDKPIFTGAMIYAVSPTMIKPIKHEKLMQIFGLTSKESKIAESISQGLSLKQIAEQQFISTNTVKFHLKNVFYKTGCSSQMALMSLFNSIPFAD